MTYLWLVLAMLPILGGAERFSCRGRILGAYYADAKSGCKAFHVCVRVAGGGIRDFRFFCPPGTLFHQEAATCTDWGDDDPLACPADLYDGQFDLYKIGSGFDTKKVSANNGNRVDDEPEFGLQRAETGDRRLNQNSQNNGASDLRAAHSSDFFSGQRERGRDEPVPAPSTTATSSRQSFRRPTSPRTSLTQYSPTAPPPTPSQHYETHKRKLVRKRPVYATSTPAPTTFTQSSLQPRQLFNEPQKNYPRPTFDEPQKNYPRPSPSFDERPKTTPPANIPPQFKEFKDEYVEVPRVTPKNNKYFISQSSTPFPVTSPTPKPVKKEGLSELYNYESQSTPGFKTQKDNRINVKQQLRNSFNVAPDLPQQDVPKNNVNVVSNGARTPSKSETNKASKNFGSSTADYRNFNSVSYEPEKNNYKEFSNSKQNFYNSPTTTAATTVFTSARPGPPPNLNTIAYNTNFGFNAQPINYPDESSDEDDGQYRLPPGEDDGQYRPELYERQSRRERERNQPTELLSGAHSLNIAASANRLPEDQKPRSKQQQVKSQTAVPRPFRPAPQPTSTTRAPEPTFTTTRPQTSSTQLPFDYYQSYTTTSRPTEEATQNYPRPSTPAHHPAPASSRAPAPPTAPASAPARPAPSTTRAPHFSRPAASKEDASYDYAYYDSDTGFSEYDHIEEFGKTKTKKA